MYIPASLFLRDDTFSNTANEIVSTADSFKSWSTCQANTTCKIVSWVGIALALIVALWILIGVIRCLCMGMSCLAATCCCLICGGNACCSGSRGHSRMKHRGGEVAEDMEYMYPDKQFAYVGTPQPVYSDTYNHNPQPHEYPYTYNGK